MKSYLAVVAGAVVFLILYGLGPLDPTKIDWIVSGDYTYQYLGWLFFKSEVWSYPPGLIDGYIYPVGTSIALSDSIPFFAIPLKLISGILPFHFQYLGFGHLLCVILQGVAAQKIFRAIKVEKSFEVPFVLLFVLATPMLYQLEIDHLQNAVHFFWLFCFALYFEARFQKKFTSFALVVLGVLSFWVHPYPCFQVLVLSLPVYFVALRDGLLSPKAFFHEVFALASLLFASYILMGYAIGVELTAVGFGDTSANLNAFFNPMGRSRVIPPLIIGIEQNEGFAYLGLGLMTLMAFSLRGIGRVNGVLPLLAAALGLFVFALSSRITFNQTELLDVSIFYSLLGPLPGMFRMSGRFVAPLYYFLIVVTFIYFNRTPWKYKTAFLAAVVAIQFGDLSEWLLSRNAWVPQRKWEYPSANWDSVVSKKKHLSLVPHQFQNLSCWNNTNVGGFKKYEVFALGVIAARSKVTFNSGLSARPDSMAMAESCLTFYLDLTKGKLDPDTIYVVHTDYEEPFKKFTSDTSDCERIDGLLVCASK